MTVGVDRVVPVFHYGRIARDGQRSTSRRLLIWILPVLFTAGILLRALRCTVMTRQNCEFLWETLLMRPCEHILEFGVLVLFVFCFPAFFRLEDPKLDPPFSEATQDTTRWGMDPTPTVSLRTDTKARIFRTRWIGLMARVRCRRFSGATQRVACFQRLKPRAAAK